MNTSPLVATVVVPTSIDRGAILELAVDSVLRQTVKDLEVFIIGDGVHDVTREAAKKLERSDSRVRFFDNPKHKRRGEPYRHVALQEARGKIVCYLCDRDLYLPDHIETMAAALSDAEFATSSLIFLSENQRDILMHGLDLSDAQDRANVVGGRLIHGLALSFMAHTLEAYRQIGEGWTSTPEGTPTDVYFARKFASDSRFRCAAANRPTVLYFPRGAHPGLSTDRRYLELLAWHNRLLTPGEPERIRERLYQGALRKGVQAERTLRNRFVYKARPVDWARLRGFVSKFFPRRMP